MWVVKSHVAQWVGCQVHAVEVVGLILRQFCGFLFFVLRTLLSKFYFIHVTVRAIAIANKNYCPSYTRQTGERNELKIRLNTH